MIARDNELGFRAIRLHYSDSPAKDPMTDAGATWLEEARKLYPDPLQWATEMEINFWVTAGLRVYPEFSETTHCEPREHRQRKVIYRAWDFGWLTPACVLAQIDERDRLIILRE